MTFYDDIKVLETIVGKDSKHKVRRIRYPSTQTVKILFVHLRRKVMPRQLDINPNKEVKTWMPKEGTFNPFFTHYLFNASVDTTGISKRSVIGAWAYIRVGTKTHLLWMRGKGKDIKFMKEY